MNKAGASDQECAGCQNLRDPADFFHWVPLIHSTVGTIEMVGSVFLAVYGLRSVIAHNTWLTQPELRRSPATARSRVGSMKC
jgi:hypothetical protein